MFLPDLAPLENSEKLRNGILDLDYLPSLLHESTHHASFDSVVGGALASLFASCFSLWTLSIGEDTLGIPARDLIVLRTAYLLLLPLVEGMALFAEHDMITGTSPVISKMTQHVLALFTKGRIQDLIDFADPATVQIIKSGKGDELMSRAHTSLLEQVREGKMCLERKALLLVQPVDAPYRYLLGYLAVKGMYRTLSRACPALKDPEVFMLVVRQQFFGDEELARILLRFHQKSDDPVVPYLQLGQDVADILNRFQDRMDELYRNTAEVSKVAIEPLLEDSGRRGLYGEEYIGRFRM